MTQRVRRRGGMRAEQDFPARVAAVLDRYLAQNGVAVPAARVARLAAALAELVRRRGLPDPQRAGRPGEVAGGGEEPWGPLARELAEEADPAALAEAALQLVKACFYPELRQCRDSFRAMGADGACRRQQLARVRTRVSGSHCVDCPHWVTLEAADHRRLLAAGWQGDPVEWEAAQAIFLPEDFRSLRICLSRMARDRK